MTEKEKFFKGMEDRNFTIHDDIQGSYSLVPHYYKTKIKDKVILAEVRFVDFGGSNTKDGELGCTTFFYSGIKRRKYHKSSERSEILQKVNCYKSCAEALGAFDKWIKHTKEVIKTWKEVI